MDRIKAHRRSIARQRNVAVAEFVLAAVQELPLANEALQPTPRKARRG